MKKESKHQFILLICFSVLLISACYSKQSDKRLHILYFENSAGEKGKTTFKYDENDFNFGAKWELLNGSRWSENYHTYDTKGNLIMKYREFSDSLTSYTWYTFNDSKLLIKEKFFRSDSISGETYYNYDKNGRLLNMDCQGLNGWFHGVIDMKYDEEGIKTRASIKKNETEIGHIDYEYKDDLLVREYWEFNQGYNQTLTYEYEEYEPISRQAYSSSNVFITNTYNYKLVLEEYDYNNQGGGPSYFEYDENGKLLKKIFVRTDSLKTITDFEYDKKGLMSKSIRNYNSGEKGIFNYTYNGNRRLIEKKFSLPNNIKGYEKYEYNGKMQLIKGELKNFDTWITGTIDFEYDKYGVLSVGYFKGERFNADIYFTFNENDNVIKYVWQFSSGETQTYSFSYEKI